MPSRIAPYQMVQTAVLDEQQRAESAAAWADTQRKDVARQWADMHSQDATDTLQPLMQASQDAPEGLPPPEVAPSGPPSMEGVYAPTQAPPDAAGGDPVQHAVDQLGVDDTGDRPPSEFEPPSSFAPGNGRSVGGSFGTPLEPLPERGTSVGGSFAAEQDASGGRVPWEDRPLAGTVVGDAMAAGGDFLLDRIEGANAQRGEMFEATGRVARDPSAENIRRAGEAVDPIALALTPEPIANAGAKAVGAAASEVSRLRLDKFPEAVRDTIEQAAGRGDFWTQQRRNVIPDDVAERMADDLNRSVEDLVGGGKSGRAYNTEETRALRNALTGQALKVDDLKQTVEALGDRASDALKRELGQEESRLLALSRVAEGARSEAGRTFRAYLTDTRGRLARAQQEYTSVSRVPTAPPPVAPGRTTPGITEQPPLITEPVATTGRATDLTGKTTTVGAGKMSVYDRASLVRMAGMLSGVPTHLLNAAGNVVQGGTTLALKEGQVGADLARVGVGRLLGKDVERTRFQAEVGPQLEGYARGFWSGMSQVGNILKGDLPQDFKKAYDARGLNSGSKVVDAAVEFPLRALAASDAVFRGAAFGGHAAALATRQATQEGLSGAARSRRVQEILGNLSDHPGLLESANKLAARDVFQEARATTTAISAFKHEHQAAKVIGDVALPFYKTPYNVAAQGAGMTPAGYASAIEAAKRGDTGEAVDRAVRATVGTLAMYAGYQLASSNLLTGAYPADASDRSTLPEGWKPYSLRIPQGDGAVYVPIQSLGAWAVPLGASAVVVDAQKRGVQKDDVMKTVLAGIGGIGQFMGDMSALQGLNSIFKLVTAPERSGEQFVESFASSLVPGSGLARQVQQALGDAQRDPDNAVQAFFAGVPGLSGLAPEKQTPLGRTRERGPAGPIAMVSGSRIGVEQPDAAVAALRAAGVGIPAAPKEIRGIPLTQEEQRTYTRAAGDRVREGVARATASPRWAGLPAEGKKAALERIVSGARDAAAAEAQRGMGRENLRSRLQQAKKPAA